MIEIPTARAARRRALALVTCALVVAFVAPARAESFVIEFAPDDGEAWTKSTVDRRSQNYGPTAPTREQVTTVETDQRYASQPDGSWIVAQSLGRITMTMNGKPVDNPMLPILRTQEIELVVNGGGIATDALGFRSLMRRYERELPPETYQNIRQQMKIDNLVLGELIKWNRALDGLHGRELETGQTLAVNDARTEFHGSVIPVTGVVEIGDWTELGGFRGVSIVYRYDNTGAILAGAGETDGEVVRSTEKEPSELRGRVELEGQIEFVVVPSSGQLLSEHLMETARAVFPQSPGQTAVIEVESTSTWTPVEEDES